MGSDLMFFEKHQNNKFSFDLLCYTPIANMFGQKKMCFDVFASTHVVFSLHVFELHSS